MPLRARFTPRKYSLPSKKPLSRTSKTESIIKKVLSEKNREITPSLLAALGTLASLNVNSTEKNVTGNKVLDLGSSFSSNFKDYLKTETGYKLASALAGVLATKYAWSSMHRAYKVPVSPKERKEMWKYYYFMKG